MGEGRKRVTQRSNVRRWLTVHAEELSACRRCGHDGVIPIVSRPKSPRAMLVGQAPGQTEVVDQRPFAGRAGRTLFRWLERAGLDEARARDVLFIAAITRCYPGPSPSGRGDRVPSRREQEHCGGWLDAELSFLRPPLLIPVGRLAIERFFGPRPLDEVVGQAIPVEHVGGRSLAIALPHPSGASSWIHQNGHAALVDDAVALLRSEFTRMGLLAGGGGADGAAGPEAAA
jgi:uracil-DNA glycosylase